MTSNEPRVLIIEDHEVLRTMLFTILRHQPLAVDTAATADEALKRVEGCDYALILIDMNLAGEDAEHFLRSFAEGRPGASTFVIAVRDAGKPVYIDPDVVSAVLNKPLELDTLADVVRECAAVMPPPADPHPCPPAESDFARLIHEGMDPN
jgi:DNA-binding response OmpR family regulator